MAALLFLETNLTHGSSISTVNNETSVLVNDSLARSWIAVAQLLVLLLSAGVVLRAMLSPDCHGSSRIIAMKGCQGSASVTDNVV